MVEGSADGGVIAGGAHPKLSAGMKLPMAPRAPRFVRQCGACVTEQATKDLTQGLTTSANKHISTIVRLTRTPLDLALA